MALKRIECKYAPNDNIRVGYKVFKRTPPHSSYDYRNEFMGNLYIMGQTATAGRLRPDDTLPSYREDSYGRLHLCRYDVGFHLFATEDEAKTYAAPIPRGTVVECIAWDIRADGTQFNRNVFVAKNIQLMREIN